MSSIENNILSAGGAHLAILQNSIGRKWLTTSVLIVLLGSTVAGLYSVWGILFVFWGFAAMKSGQAYLIEPIDRAETPFLFWALTGLWFVFGGLYILADIIPEYLI